MSRTRWTRRGASIEDVASEFTTHFGRRKVGALDVAGNPDAETALVTIGTIGDSALELLEDNDDLLLVRIHAFRPFPGGDALGRAGRRRPYVIGRSTAPSRSARSARSVRT